jgi:hypothetical protein
MRIPLSKIVRVAVPAGTLLFVFFGWLAARVGERPMVVPSIIPRPPPTLPALVLAGGGHRVQGRVVDAEQHAVADALVWLRAGDEPDWTYTDSDGAFRMQDVGAGPWPVVVLAHGYAPYKGSIDVTSIPCTIAIGAVLPDVPLRQPILRAPLVGHISSELAGDVAGYEVWLAPRVAPETLGVPLPRRATCDEGGNFRIDDLAHGEYVVRVIPAWARGGSWPDLTQALAGGAPTTWTHGGIESAAEDTAEHPLEVTLSSGEIRGVLRTEAGDPVEGALVLLSRADDASRIWPPISTAADGSFVARDLPPGSYSVSIRAGAAAVKQVATLSARQSLVLDVPALNFSGGH